MCKLQQLKWSITNSVIPLSDKAGTDWKLQWKISISVWLGFIFSLLHLIRVTAAFRCWDKTSAAWPLQASATGYHQRTDDTTFQLHVDVEVNPALPFLNSWFKEIIWSTRMINLGRIFVNLLELQKEWQHGLHIIVWKFSGELKISGWYSSFLKTLATSFIHTGGKNQYVLCKWNTTSFSF